MSPKEKIAKLEALLARVKERAEAPRANGAAAFPAPAVSDVRPAQSIQVAHAAQPAHAAVGSAVPSSGAAESLPPETIASLPPDPAPLEARSGWSDAPAETSSETSGHPAVEAVELEAVEAEEDLIASDYMDDDVEVSAEVVEVDIDIDEPGALPVMPAESGAQPIADHALFALDAPVLEDGSDDLLAVTASAPPPATTVEAAPIAPANELVEPAPSSSPRPIVAQPELEPYEEESAPRHTPPPESGKQVAAPSVKPEHDAVEPRTSSTPPPSLEGHTLVGGWREPGVPAAPARERAGEAPRPLGVRVPPPPPPPPAPAVELAPATAPGAAPARFAPAAAPARLVPEVIAPEPPAGDVAAFEGAPRTFAPSTFGELLDATLAL